MPDSYRHHRTWALVLAGGNGSRVRELTGVPKQYCTFGTGKSLLRLTLERARGTVSPGCVMTVVDRSHQYWWLDELGDQPSANIVVQPTNRGTAVGILLPLLELWWRQPDANVVILPSDHGVGNETVLQEALGRALDEVCLFPEHLVLLGMTPSGPETSYGWIVPDAPANLRARRVRRFVEKPDVAAAEELFATGGLWSSFLLAGRLSTLLWQFQLALPQLLGEFLASVRPGDTRPEFADRGDGLHALYRNLPSWDFSRHVLERAARHLRVLTVPPCGWSDLGTPARLMAFFGQTISAAQGQYLQVPAAGARRGHPDLAVGRQPCPV